MCGPHLHTLDLHGSQIQIYIYIIYSNTKAPDKQILLYCFWFLKISLLLEYRVGGWEGSGMRPYNICFGIYTCFIKKLYCVNMGWEGWDNINVFRNEFVPWKYLYCVRQYHILVYKYLIRVSLLCEYGMGGSGDETISHIFSSALRALGLSLADCALTVGRGKTFWLYPNHVLATTGKKLFKEKSCLCPNNQGGKCHFGWFFG